MPTAPELFARYCGVVMDRFGDRIRLAVTFNEPDLPEMLTWADLPDFVAISSERRSRRRERDAGVERYRAGNVMLHEDFAGMRAGMTAAHLAAKAAIKERRADLPVGLSLAMCDDVAAPGGEELVTRKRAEVYDYWLRLAADDDFVGVQNYERLRLRTRTACCLLAEVRVLNGMGTPVDPDSLRGAVEYAYAVSGVPVLVSEHGVSTPDDSIRAAFIAPSLEGLAQRDRRRRAGARLLPLDADGQLRVDLRLRPDSSGCTPSTGRPSSARPSRAQRCTPSWCAKRALGSGHESLTGSRRIRSILASANHFTLRHPRRQSDHTERGGALGSRLDPRGVKGLRPAIWRGQKGPPWGRCPPSGEAGARTQRHCSRKCDGIAEFRGLGPHGGSNVAHYRGATDSTDGHNASKHGATALPNRCHEMESPDYWGFFWR